MPMLDIFAQAPTTTTATTLANAAVAGLRQYLSSTSASQRIPNRDQVRLLQLGQARGEVINHGVYWQVAVLVFLLTFGLALRSS